MKINIIKHIVCLCLLCWTCGLYAQESIATNMDKYSSEDPLIEQQFAVDTKTQTMVVIDTPENSIVILKRNSQSFDIVKSIEVDKTYKRHDIQFIYKPKSVAIYEDNIVFLASNRDSSYIEVVTLKGEQVFKSNKFAGAASTFSYDKNTKRLYIAGLNASGYNIFDIDCSNGFRNIVIDTISTDKASYVNYRIPKKSEQMAKHDPHGIALTVIAMCTVFFALFVISIFLMGFAKTLKRIKQASQTKKVSSENKAEVKQQFKDTTATSGEVYAAISAAIYMYNEQLHDEENTVLTINQINRRYSPWSSKTYNMNVYRRK